jgi:transposase
MTLEGMGPSMAVEGSTTQEVFEAYLEQVLLPKVHEGQVLIMDSLPAHKPNRMRELIEQRGCELLYLPSYSPEYNPIEEAFSKIKEILRRAQARNREALVEAIGQALSAISSKDAWSFFKHAGYHPVGQLL